MTNIQTYTNQNRLAWEEIAEIRHKRWEPAEFFAQGGSWLDEHTVTAVGNVQELTLCHLQCATGEDTLSWANQGAVVTGVDISPTQIELAQQKAADAGISARFIASDIYDLPQALFNEQFDIVFTGGGALVWLPDIDRWAQTVARLLKPSGRLILDEEHPFAECLWVEGGELKIESDYFGRHQPELYTGWSHFAGGEDASEQKYEFTWPLGDIVTSLAQAGLRIERLEERPSDTEWRFKDRLSEVARLPGQYLLIARRDP
ncbi:MAG: class I SAM-dependent methyltransferase [Chloroflexota bacterium]